MSKDISFIHNNKKIPISIEKSRRKSIVLSVSVRSEISIKSPKFILNSELKRFIDERSGWITKRLLLNQDVVENHNYPINNDNIDDLRPMYRKLARIEITKLVDRYTEEIGIKYNTIYIREQKTRWGSCSGLKNLNFNWKVMLTTPDLIEYLVIHEVCHLVHMNHSKDFWNLVEKICPDYKLRRKRLQEAGVYLLSFLQ